MDERETEDSAPLQPRWSTQTVSLHHLVYQAGYPSQEFLLKVETSSSVGCCCFVPCLVKSNNFILEPLINRDRNVLPYFPLFLSLCSSLSTHTPINVYLDSL